MGLPAGALAAGAAIAHAAVNAQSQLFGATLRHTSQPSQIAITFDDGPNPAITPKLLDLLDQHQAKATFFMIGRWVRECPDLVREIARRGHCVGNHTHTHPNLFWLTPGQVHKELQQCQDALRDALGAAPVYFRPPYGLRNPWVVPVARRLGMQTVMWTMIPGDWHQGPVGTLIRTMEPIAQHAMQAATRTSGDVLCLHDGTQRALGGDRTRTLRALEVCLPRWRELGLKFVTIADAVKAPAG